MITNTKSNISSGGGTKDRTNNDKCKKSSNIRMIDKQQKDRFR